MEEKDLFNKLRKDLLNIDPVAFCEENLTLDGKPFRLSGNGYKPLSDIYRYVGVKALEPNSLPIIIVKGRQVGATTMASALEMYFMGSGLFGNGNKSAIRVMHAFPQLDLAAAYAKTKLQQMIVASNPVIKEDAKKGLRTKSFMQNLLDPSSPANDSQAFKQFVGGNHLWIESLGLDGDRVMGKSVDVLLFDEIQKTSTQAVGNALKILTTAKYGKPSKGVQVYFGTPRRKGSDFQKMWQKSSQQYYYLGCGSCKKHFPFYTPESDDWEKIWLHGFIVKCTFCGYEQNKLEAAERGKWVALKNPNDEDCLMVGFHINQLYMPMFTKEDIIKEKPGIHLSNTERTFQNEVMGEFFQGDSSPITPEQIRECCGDVGRKFTARIDPGTISSNTNNQIVIMGIDYGAKADMEQLANPDAVKNIGKSYSTAVILIAKGPELLSIEYACKFKRNDMAGKKSLIDELMRRYSVNLAVGDIGFSQDFSTNLHIEYGDRYLVSRAHNKLKKTAQFYKDMMPKEIMFERDHYIGELFEVMKNGKIRFPLGDYEKVSWLIEHCASMEIKPSISKVGEPTIHYAKGGTPNDGFMALLNAYLAYKFLLTDGFSNMNPLLQRQGIGAKKPLILNSYIPNR